MNLKEFKRQAFKNNRKLMVRYYLTRPRFWLQSFILRMKIYSGKSKHFHVHIFKDRVEHDYKEMGFWDRVKMAHAIIFGRRIVIHAKTTLEDK